MGNLNNKAQVFFYALMLGMIIIFLALGLAGPIKDTVDSARNATTDEGQVGLDCTNSTISNFQKGACVVADLTIFHFVGGLIFIAGAVIVAKLLL
jgi:Trk-type K+ transport system membrane component|tara:strand:+ start:6640 stop:6924 length:285 start_codon:yes stop_codon:yes gene_type:complete